jgi:uncharacterized membrane protein
MGCILIPLVLSIGILLLWKYKSDSIELFHREVTFPILFFVFLGIFLFCTITATRYHYKYKVQIMNYNPNNCGLGNMLFAEEMKEHKALHDDWLVGAFYSDSIANLPLPHCEQK